MTARETEIEQHVALNNLMNNSQVFLAFALPFSMLPLLLMTNSGVEMGERFKNRIWVNVLGWLSVVGLTFLNLLGLSDSIADFFGDNPSAGQLQTAHMIAYVLIVLVLALLAWTIWDLYKGNKRYAAKLQAEHEAAVAKEAASAKGAAR